MSRRFRRCRSVALACACAAAVSGVARAQVPGQPYASYWYPSTILNWNPATDPDAAFNRSNVPLATRISTIQQVNPNATTGAGITSLVAYAPTSNNPSQGSAVMKYYANNYWQYQDTQVFWGGSAGEGTILAPNATVIDAAHRNGVRVLGNVFFPPTQYGGQIGWVNDFLQQRGDGSFPVADKMIQAAQFYGFDGWFLNQETAGGNATTATKMQSFINYVHAKAPTMHVQWYDAMDKNGAINWQGALNSNNSMFFDTTPAANTGKVADSMMLDFRWFGSKLDSSLTTAASLGRSPFDLQTGVDVEANGYNTSVDWSGLTTNNKLKTNLALYRPEWTNNSASSVADFYARDNKFWVGPNADPSNTTTADAWKGLANYVNAKSAIRSAPFVTNFNTGQGNRYVINGQQLATGEWNNLSVQDVLPTYRWLMTSTGTKLTPSLDFNDAYYGGTSLLVAGNLQAVNDLKLYQTEIPVAANTNFRITLKPNASNPLVKLGVSFTDNPNSFTYLDVGSGMTTGLWNSVVLPLGSFAGKTLADISLRFGDGTTSLTSYSTRIGQFAIYNGAPSTPAAPTTPSIDNQLQVSQSGATTTSLPLRVHWTHSTDTPYAYNLYRKNPTGTLSFLGATPNNAYFVPAVKRISTENFVTLQVETVGLDFGTSAKTSYSFYVDWPRAAQTLLWQGNGSTFGGAGTWDGSALNWNAGATAPANQYWSNSHADTATFAGQSAGAVTVAGPVTVGGMNFAIDGFTVGGAGAITLSGSAGINVTNASDTATINVPLVGSGGQRKFGNGTLVLGGASTYAGATQVLSGTLVVNGSLGAGTTTVSTGARLGGTGALAGAIDASGTVAPGAGLRAASAHLRAGSTLLVNLATGSAGSLTLTGAATIDGGATLDVRPAAGFVPQAGQTFDVLAGSQVAGSFSNYANLLTPAANGLVLAPEYLSDRVRLTAVLPGDATLDGTVDFNDLVKLAQSYNTTLTGVTPNTWEAGDFNLDGGVDFNDLVKLAQNYNTSASTPAAGSLPAAFAQEWAAAQAAAPEPGGLVALLAAVVMGRRRRRRGRPGPSGR